MATERFVSVIHSAQKNTNTSQPSTTKRTNVRSSERYLANYIFGYRKEKGQNISVMANHFQRLEKYGMKCLKRGRGVLVFKSKPVNHFVRALNIHMWVHILFSSFHCY